MNRFYILFSNKRSLLTVSLFALSALVAVFLGFLVLSPKEALGLFGTFGYVWIAASFWVFCVFAGVQSRAPLRAFLQRGWRTREALWAFLVIVGCSGYCIGTESWRMRVIMDEPILMATSFTMATQGAVYVPSRAYQIGEDFLLMDSVIEDSMSRNVDKRPLLYPFLTSLLHGVRGFSFENGSFCNNILCVVFFLLLYLFLREGMHWVLAACGLVLTASLPMLPWVVNGAGMDVIALVMLLATFLALRSYLRAPEPWRLSTLCLAAFLLVQSRYEMALFVPIVGAGILWGWLKARRVISSIVFLITPLLFIPYAWQQQVFFQNADPFDLRFAAHEGVLEAPYGAFSKNYILSNFWENLGFFFGTSLTYPKNHPNSFLLSLFGLFGLLYYLWALWRQPGRLKTDPFFQVLSFLVFGVFGVFMLYMAYAWGDMTQRITYRFSLPFSIVGVVVFCWALDHARWRPALLRFATALTALVVLAYSYPMSRLSMHRTEYFFQNALYAQKDWVAERFWENPLFISDMPFLSIVQGSSSLSCFRACINKEKLLCFKKAHPERPIYVIAIAFVKKDYKNYTHELERHGFVLERLYRMASFGLTGLRILDFFKLEDIHLTPEEQLKVPDPALLPKSFLDLQGDPQNALGLYLLP